MRWGVCVEGCARRRIEAPGFRRRHSVHLPAIPGHVKVRAPIVPAPGRTNCSRTFSSSGCEAVIGKAHNRREKIPGAAWRPCYLNIGGAIACHSLVTIVGKVVVNTHRMVTAPGTDITTQV